MAEVAAPAAAVVAMAKQQPCGGGEILAFRGPAGGGGGGAAVPAVDAADSSGKFDPADQNSMPSNFTIRGFVSLVRKQDIRQTWPFSEELLQRYLREGKTLPHLDAPPPPPPLPLPPVATTRASSSGDQEDSGDGDGDGDASRATAVVDVAPQQRLELQFHFEDQSRDGSKGMDAAAKDPKAVELDSQHSRHNSAVVDHDTASVVMENRSATTPDRGTSVLIKSSSGSGTGEDIDLLGAAGIKGGALDHGQAKLDKGLDCIEDKASDTGAEEVEGIQGGGHGSDRVEVVTAAANDPGSEEDAQQSNVCPVCSSFSCHSVTALNAHIDGCLSAAAGDVKCPKVAALRSGGGGGGSGGTNATTNATVTTASAAGNSNNNANNNVNANAAAAKSSGKVQKMRSITDIIAADPAPSPRSDSTAKNNNHQSEPVVRERRAPNHVVVLADKEAGAVISKSSASGQHQAQQRNLRSRSRGSRSLMLASPKQQQQQQQNPPPDSSERPTRRRRRECTGNCQVQKSDWSEQKKARHCSGNSVEVTSSWTPSISSGTYCHSKAQENAEKIIIAGNCEPSESHGSANCLQNPSGVQQSEQQQGKKPATTTATTTVVVTDDSSSNKADCEKPSEVAAPTRTDTCTDRDRDRDQAFVLQHPGEQNLEPAHEASVVENAVDGDGTGSGSGSIDAAVKKVVDQPPDSNTGVITAASSSPGEVCMQKAAESAAAAAGCKQQNGTVHRPRSVIPLYDSMISSLRLTSVDSVTGSSHFNNPTWKAAVVMATLGASLSKTSSTPSTPASAVTSIGNSDQRADLASDSICVSVVPVVDPAGPKPGRENSQQAADAIKAAASERAAASVHGLYFQTRHVSAAVDKSKFPFSPTEMSGSVTKVHHQIPKMPGWMHGSGGGGGDRPTVIDVDQIGLIKPPQQQGSTSSDGKGSGSGSGAEKPVLRLLGQNVMVETSKDAQAAAAAAAVAAKTPFGFAIPHGVHAAGAGYHTPCCCSSRSTAAEHITFALGKDLSLPYQTGTGGISQIPLPGTWRILPNGILSQVNGPQISLAPGKLGATAAAAAAQLNCCIQKSQHPHQQQIQQQIQQQQSQSGLQQKSRSCAGEQKNAGELPPWLLAAKKQKEAEANVIVIDDDDADDENVTSSSAAAAKAAAATTTTTTTTTTSTTSKPDGNAAGSATAAAADVEFTGERNVRVSDKAPVVGRQQFSHKREAAADWMQQQQHVEKSVKVGAGDSPHHNQVANKNLGIPVLVPTWMISAAGGDTSNNSGGGGGGGSGGANPSSKRGATAQAYKARIAMMKAFMHGSSDGAAVVAANPTQIPIHHHQQQQQQRSLAANLPAGACLYQVPATTSTQQPGGPRVIQIQTNGGGSDLTPGIMTHGVLGQHHHQHQHQHHHHQQQQQQQNQFFHQQQQQQQQLSLLLGKDYQIIELEDGQCLLLNSGGHSLDATTDQQQQQQQQIISENAAAAAAESLVLGKRLVRDASGRNFVLCNDVSGTAAAGVVHHDGGSSTSSSGATGRGDTGAKILVTPVLHGDASGYHGIVLAAPPGDHHHLHHLQHSHGHGGHGHGHHYLHHHHLLHHQLAAAAAAAAASAPPHAVLPLSIQQQQQIKLLQGQMRPADKGVVCSWSYGQKS